LREADVNGERIVAVGLLTERELALVGQELRRIYRVDEDESFTELLTAIDLADAKRSEELKPRLER